MDQIILVICTALISGLLATMITLWWQKKSEIRKEKMDIFRILMSRRYRIVSEESVSALNAIDIVFYKDKDVRAAYENFQNEADKKPEFNPNINDKHLKLLEEMAKALNLKDIHWDDIKRSYYPKGLSEKIREEDTLRKIQIQNASSSLAESQKTQENTPSGEQFAQQAMIQMLPELLKNPESLKALIELGKQKR